MRALGARLGKRRIYIYISKLMKLFQLTLLCTATMKVLDLQFTAVGTAALSNEGPEACSFSAESDEICTA